MELESIKKTKHYNAKDNCMINYNKRRKNLRDNSGIKIAIFSLEITSLKSCECNANFQIYLLPSIHS